MARTPELRQAVLDDGAEAGSEVWACGVSRDLARVTASAALSRSRGCSGRNEFGERESALLEAAAQNAERPWISGHGGIWAGKVRRQSGWTPVDAVPPGRVADARERWQCRRAGSDGRVAGSPIAWWCRSGVRCGNVHRNRANVATTETPTPTMVVAGLVEWNQGGTAIKASPRIARQFAAMVS